MSAEAKDAGYWDFFRKWNSPEARRHFREKYPAESLEIDDPEPLGDETPFDPDGAFHD